MTVATPLTLKALLELCRPAEVQLSPDGGCVSFTAKGGLWTVAVDGQPVPIGEEGTTQAVPRWSPDGARLAYLSDASHPGRMSLRLYGVGEVGSVPGSAEDVRWSPGGELLLVLA